MCAARIQVNVVLKKLSCHLELMLTMRFHRKRGLKKLNNHDASDDRKTIELPTTHSELLGSIRQEWDIAPIQEWDTISRCLLLGSMARMLVDSNTYLTTQSICRCQIPMLVQRRQLPWAKSNAWIRASQPPIKAYQSDQPWTQISQITPFLLTQ